MKIIADMHTHSLPSGHAYSSPMENIRHADEIKLSYLGESEHAPKMSGACREIYFRNLSKLPSTYNGLKIYKGAELNILNRNGEVDLKDSTIDKLDYCVASIHKNVYEDEEDEESILCAYENVMKINKVKIIGHPDDGRFKCDYAKLVEACVKNNKLIELNNSSLSPNSFRPNAYENSKKILKECIKQGCMIILSSDAHIEFDIGVFDNCLRLINEINFPEELIINSSINEKRFKEYFL